MRRIVEIRNIQAAEQTFEAVYSDGDVVRINLKPIILQALADDNTWVSALAEPDFFRQISLVYGAPTWPNEFDLCPDALWLTHSILSRGQHPEAA